MEAILIELVKLLGVVVAAWFALKASRYSKTSATETQHNGGGSLKDAAVETRDVAVRIEQKFDAFARESRTDRAHIWRTLTEHGIRPAGD